MDASLALAQSSSPAPLCTLDDSVLCIILQRLGLYSIVRFCNTCRLLAQRRRSLLAALPEATKNRLAETLFRELRKMAGQSTELQPTAVPPRVFLDVVSVLQYEDVGAGNAAGAATMAEQGAPFGAAGGWLAAGRPLLSLCVPRRRLGVVIPVVSSLNVPLIETALAWAQDMPLAELERGSLVLLALETRDERAIRAALALIKARPALVGNGIAAPASIFGQAQVISLLHKAVSCACSLEDEVGVELVKQILAALPDDDKRRTLLLWPCPTDQSYTPLHRALEQVHLTNTHFRLVKMLAEAAPAALETPAGRLRSLPIHLAAQHMYGPQGARIVELLLDLAPGTVSRTNADGWTPLHLSAQWQGSRALAFDGFAALLQVWPEKQPALKPQPPKGMEVALALLRRGPAVARQPVPANGYMRLHHICEHQRGEAGLEFLEALLAIAPEVADIPTSAGFYPIHIAAKFQNRPSGPAFVRRLLAAASNPMPLKAPGGSTVLHLVAEGTGGKAAAELVQLFEKQASATGASISNVSDDDGLVSLHKVFISESVGKDDAAVARALLTSWPDAAVATTRTGWTPLHLVAENVADADTAEMLAQLLLAGVGAETATSVTSDGLWTPLHVAVSKRKYETAITILQHGGPAAARMPNSCRRLPLHIFALKPVLDTTPIVTEGAPKSGPTGVLACLAEAHPAAFVTEDDYGWLPLHLAAQAQKNGPFFQEFIKAAKHTLLRPVVKPQISFCTALKQPHKAEAEATLLGDRAGLLPIHAAAMGHREPPPPDEQPPARWVWTMATAPAVHHRNPVEILLDFDKGMARAAVGNFLLTPMHIAAFYGATPEAKALHVADAEVVTMRTKNGHLPLHLAAAGQHPDMFIEVLLMWPEAIDQVSTDGRTPLSYVTSEYAAGRLLAAAQETIAPRVHMMTGLTEEARRRIIASPGAAAPPPGLQLVYGADGGRWL